jgi:hypothetical protein
MAIPEHIPYAEEKILHTVFFSLDPQLGPVKPDSATQNNPVASMLQDKRSDGKGL